MDDDRRFWSITAANLSQLATEFTKLGIWSTSVRNLQDILRQRDIYPARDFEYLCSRRPPDVFFSYHSAQNFIDVQDLAWRSGDFVGRLLRSRQPTLDRQDIEPLVANGITFWVDFVFINQSSRDIPKELDALPRLLEMARAHFVVGAEPLTRSWCCYEIALFNARNAGFGSDRPALRSFVAPSLRTFPGWDLTETSEAKDKTALREAITRQLPSGFKGFERIIAEASLSAALSAIEPTPAYPPLGIVELLRAAEEWLARTTTGTAPPG